VVVHDADVDRDGSGGDARVAEDVARELPRAVAVTTSGRAMMVEGNEDGLATYTAAKLGVVGLMFGLAAEGASHGIRVNAVSPVAATRMLRRRAEPGELEPEQVAPAVVFLASGRLRPERRRRPRVRRTLLGCRDPLRSRGRPGAELDSGRFRGELV